MVANVCWGGEVLGIDGGRSYTWASWWLRW